MPTLKEAANDFLAQKRIAVAGVSRTPAGHGANVVYTGLRKAGYQVFAVNPHADQVEGDTCYHDIKSIPGGVDAVVIGTAPRSLSGCVA
jgi:predicted CoA-binding protein